MSSRKSRSKPRHSIKVSVSHPKLKRKSNKKFQTKPVYSAKKSRINSIKSTPNLKEYQKDLDHHYKIIKTLDKKESDLEMYAISNKIIYLIFIQLLLMGTTKSIRMAKDYSNKMGVNLCDIPGVKSAVSEKTLQKIENCAPSIKNTVKRTRERYYAPDRGSMASGWVWN